jgi:hypothetical protein
VPLTGQGRLERRETVDVSRGKNELVPRLGEALGDRRPDAPACTRDKKDRNLPPPIPGTCGRAKIILACTAVNAPPFCSGRPIPRRGVDMSLNATSVSPAVDGRCAPHARTRFARGSRRRDRGFMATPILPWSSLQGEKHGYLEFAASTPGAVYPLVAPTPGDYWMRQERRLPETVSDLGTTEMGSEPAVGLRLGGRPQIASSHRSQRSPSPLQIGRFNCGEQ